MSDPKSNMVLLTRQAWEELQETLEGLRLRVADLEVEVDRTIIATGDMARQGYATCEADIREHIGRSGPSITKAELLDDLERGEHRGAAARKDDNG